MITPPPLVVGSQIRILASARKISEPEFMPGVKMLESWGFRVTLGENLLSTHHQFAGTDEQRALDLQTALDDSSVAAILFVRGGYGTGRIIDRLNWEKFKSSPKWLAGYSDITVLHSHVNRLGFATLHSTMPVNMAQNSPEALHSLRNAFTGECLRYTFPAHPLNRGAALQGEVVGGNLSLLANLTGTPSQLNAEGKILFLEDLDEYLYHLDRMMHQMRRSGQLADLAGLVVGGMTDMKDNTVPFGASAEEIIADSVANYHYPVIFGLPCGHVSDNRTLVMGANANCMQINGSEVEWNQLIQPQA